MSQNDRGISPPSGPDGVSPRDGPLLIWGGSAWEGEGGEGGGRGGGREGGGVSDDREMRDSSGGGLIASGDTPSSAGGSITASPLPSCSVTTPSFSLFVAISGPNTISFSESRSERRCVSLDSSTASLPVLRAGGAGETVRT